MAVKNIHLKNEKAIRLDLFLREKLPQVLSSGETNVVRIKSITTENSADSTVISEKATNVEVSNSKIRRLIVAGAVSVNARQIRIPGFDLRPMSDVFVVIDEDKFFFEKQPDDIQFELDEKNVLFEDEYLIVVNKPAFFPTEATIVGNRDNLHDSVVRYLWKKNPTLRNPPYVGIMHRLDRETSGVILFTKQRSVNAWIHDVFDSSNPEHSARKIYKAVCVEKSGASLRKNDTFSVEMFMGRTSVKSQAAKWGLLPENRGGVFSHTDFTVKGTGVVDGKKVLYIEARPITGRTHQIRVHLSSRSLPILGDVLYGAPSSERIMLHAASLTFVHPISKEPMTIEAPCDWF